MARGTGVGAQGSEGGGCRGPGPGAGRGGGPGAGRGPGRGARLPLLRAQALCPVLREKEQTQRSRGRYQAHCRYQGRGTLAASPPRQGRARPGWAGLGWAARAAARPGSGAWIWGRRGVDGAGRGGPDLKGPQHRRRRRRRREGAEWGPAPAIPTGSRSPAWACASRPQVRPAWECGSTAAGAGGGGGAPGPRYSSWQRLLRARTPTPLARSLGCFPSVRGSGWRGGLGAWSREPPLLSAPPRALSRSGASSGARD